MKSATFYRNGIFAMFKSAAIAAAEAGALVVVTSLGAIALRLYSLAYRARRPVRAIAVTSAAGPTGV
jgi:hypothetical protein